MHLADVAGANLDHLFDGVITEIILVGVCIVLLLLAALVVKSMFFEFLKRLGGGGWPWSDYDPEDRSKVKEDFGDELTPPARPADPGTKL